MMQNGLCEAVRGQKEKEEEELDDLDSLVDFRIDSNAQASVTFCRTRMKAIRQPWGISHAAESKGGWMEAWYHKSGS